MPGISNELNKDDLSTIILALDELFRNCQEHRDHMIDMDEEDFEQLSDQMEFGELLLRFARVYERIDKQ